MSTTLSRDDRYLGTVLRAIRVCAAYKPKMGHGVKAGLSLTDFRLLYGGDPFYKWFGLDNPLMYAAHKAAGGMTSVYRQIGTACESLFRAILQDELGLSDEESNWSYSVTASGRKPRSLSLDARIPLAAIVNPAARRRVAEWMRRVGKDLDVEPNRCRRKWPAFWRPFFARNEHEQSNGRPTRYRTKAAGGIDVQA